MYYQSDALHWNLSQIDTVGKLGQKALMSEHLNEPHGRRLDILKKEAMMNGFGLVIA
jgi:hypothetical protein|uniref:Uncharacterized protein n=1 Tax=Candidatus Methanogaster sp. ANME-2c ERB4 TaxID=2759911 RepID=A0A7G9YCW4_9EURY|nr:hypothetical protein JFPJJDFG_00007 [Methanosarcinales archaeon ANME-2c ERB4]QNO45848.1 hypothetical protein CLCIFPGF_00005 [Methanosarcinales archaeon ANME-2c ERB4]